MNPSCRSQDPRSSGCISSHRLPAEMKRAASHLGQGYCPDRASRNGALALLRLQLQMNQLARENRALRSRRDNWL